MGNRTLLRETAAVVRAFADGRTDVEELQAKLQSAMALLDRTGDASEVAPVMHDVEGDLELIRFTVFGDEVRPAAMRALAPLIPHLPGPDAS